MATNLRVHKRLPSEEAPKADSSFQDVLSLLWTRGLMDKGAFRIEEKKFLNYLMRR